MHSTSTTQFFKNRRKSIQISYRSESILWHILRLKNSLHSEIDPISRKWIQRIIKPLSVKLPSDFRTQQIMHSSIETFK